MTDQIRLVGVRVIIVTLSTALGACASPEDRQPTALDVLPTITHAGTQASAAKTTPSPTTTPTATPVLPTSAGPTPTILPFTALNLGDDFLFEGQTPDCTLPCWQGLRIGEASEEDVLREFDEYFDYATVPRSQRTSGFTLYSIPPEGLQISGYRWEISEGHFDAVSLLDNITSVTRALIFDHSAPPNSNEFMFYTPQDFLRSLGEPTAIHAEFLELAPNAPYAGLARFYIAYNEGVAALMVMHYETISLETFEFCLGQESTNQIIYLFEPYTEPGDLNDLQNVILRRTGLYPRFEDIFGLSPAEVTNLAVTLDNACLQFQ